MKRDTLKLLGIDRAEVDRLTVQEHVRAFIDVFIRPDSRARASSLWQREGFSNRFASCVMQRIDERLCLPDDKQSRPASWPAQFSKPGIRIDRDGPGLAMTVEQASASSADRARHFLFSIEVGRLAVFFEHEWGVWYCSAPNKTQRPTGAPGGAGI